MNIWRVSWSVATVAVLALVSVAVPTAGRAVGAIAAPSRHVAKQHTKSSSGCKPKVKAKGTIVWSDSEFPSNISPYQGSGAASGEVEAAYLEGLDTINSQGRFIPDLLQSLPKLSGLTVHAQLKHGMRWSNGQEITAADVAFGWRIGMSTLEGTSWCSGACDVINSIRTQGKYGLVFHLKHRSPTFISSALYYLPVWPPSWKGGWSSWNVKQAVKKLFGDTKYTFTNSSYPTNGAYQVTGFFKNDRIVLKPMKYYHIMTCGAGLKKLIFAAYNNKDDMIAGAASRATDITTDYTWDDLKKLASYTRVFKTLTGPSFYFEKLEFNVDPKFQGKINPLSKVKVRQALALAIDKVGLIRSVMGMTKNAAQNIVAWDPLILTRRTAQPFADKAITGQWDPIRHRYVSATGSGMALADAKKLLKQAGYPGGNFTVQAVTTSDDPTRQNEFSVLQNNWARVGVNFSAKYVDSGTFFGDWQEGSPRSRGTFQVDMWADEGGPDPSGFVFEVQSKYIDRDHKVHSSSNDNYSGIKNHLIDEAYNKVLSTYNHQARAHWYDVFQVQMNKNAYWVPLWYWGDITTTDGKVPEYGTNPILPEEWNVYRWTTKASGR